MPDIPTDDTVTEQAKPQPWGDDFDPERAWRLVENLRADKAKRDAEIADVRAALAAREDAEKTELQKATERAERAEKELTTATVRELRRVAAAKHNLPEGVAEHLSGESAEEIDAKAAALAALFPTPAPAAPGEEIPGKPAPKLTPGHATEAPEDFDPIALADRVHARRLG